MDYLDEGLSFTMAIKKRSKNLLAKLRERAKELSCLYAVEKYLREQDTPSPEFFKNLCALIPSGWQYPALCRAHIEIDTDEYSLPKLEPTPWGIDAVIEAQGKKIGTLYIHYTKECPSADEGPFLYEEIRLINSLADRIGHFIFHKRLKKLFGTIPLEDGHHTVNLKPGWRAALSFLEETNEALYVRISRKMMNYLFLGGVQEASSLLKRYGADRRAEDLLAETNQPKEKTSQIGLLSLCAETFKLASKHVSDSEILDRIRRWIREDKTGMIVKPLADITSPLSVVVDAIKRYQLHAVNGDNLPTATRANIIVSLIRRFLSDQLEFVNVAKQFIDVEDFYNLIDSIVAPAKSHGKLGGKSAGLILAERILNKEAAANPAIGHLKIPKAWHICSDGILDFIHYNEIGDVHEQKYKSITEVRLDYPHIVQVFKNSHFSQEMRKGLSLALDDFGDSPLIVRSSSLLEDRLGSAFSGKYKSLFLANQGTKKERLDALTDAIAEVYASTFGPDPIEYRAERGLLDFGEEMGILIQEVVGTKVGKYFFPAFSGVAFSKNEFRWSPRIRREDGLVRIVPGLGTRAVDRVADDYPILASPGKPRLRVNVSPEETIRYAPKYIDLINLESRSFETRLVTDIISEVKDDYPNIGEIVSIYSEGRLKRPVLLTTDFGSADSVVTFQGILSDSPFLKQMNAILKTLEKCMGYPVDIEFASDGKDLYLLQCRPQCYASDTSLARIPEYIPPNDLIFTANRFVSNGRVPDITHIVYVVPEFYQQLTELDKLRAVGRTIGALNKVLPKRKFILLGPGRWGSRGDIKLGVRVTYSDINNTAMLIEIARKKGNYTPDLSFGTHFFQDLVEASIRYLPLYPDTEGNVFNENFFLNAPNVLAELVPEYAYLHEVVRVIDVRKTNNGRILRVVQNADQNVAKAFICDSEMPVSYDDDFQSNSIDERENHWHWRLKMAERIGSTLDAKRFGVRALYVFGSAKNACAGPASDIDLLVHFHGDSLQRKCLELWFEGWSLALDEMNYARTGCRCDGILDIHIITDEDIEKRDSYACKIGAVTDAARQIPIGEN